MNLFPKRKRMLINVDGFCAWKMSLSATRDDYTVGDSMGSYRARLHLNAFARADEREQSLFIAPGAHCRVFVITVNAVLITQSFYSSSILTILLQHFSVRIHYHADARFQHQVCEMQKIISVDAHRQASKSLFPSTSLSSCTTDISYVAFVFHSHISSATLTTSSAEYSGRGECPVSRNRPATKMVSRNRIYRYKE